MIKTLTYNLLDPLQWQALVEQSSYATWFQTKDAYEFYAALPEEMEPFAIGVEEDGHLTGVIVGYTTQEKNPIKQLLTCRSIIIGGPLLDEHISNNALSALLEMIGKESTGVADLQPAGRSTAKRSTGLSPIYIETRNFHDYSKWKSVFESNGFKYQPHLNIQVTCDAAHTMSEQRIRQVKKALKNGVEIVEASSEQEIRDWYEILYKLYR